MDWPDNADGQVFRNLKGRGFPFDRKCLIDFNVDYEAWPPSRAAIEAIGSAYPEATVSVVDGYLMVQVLSLLTYSMVMDMQLSLTRISAPFGGCCESWGVLWKPADNA